MLVSPYAVGQTDRRNPTTAAGVTFNVNAVASAGRFVVVFPWDRRIVVGRTQDGPDYGAFPWGVMQEPVMVAAEQDQVV